MNGDSTEIEFLVLTGRFKEAAQALRRSAAVGAPAFESFIWLGRIEENRGRLEQAEDAFRKALSVAPASPLPRVELSRFLEKTGRSAEACELLWETAEGSAGELNRLLAKRLRGGFSGDAGKNLYALMKFSMFRRVFVDILIEKGEDIDLIEAATRADLGAVPRHPGARILLAEVLIARGRLQDAEETIVPAFGAGATGMGDSRIELLLGLIERGRYGPAAERALLRANVR